MKLSSILSIKTRGNRALKFMRSRSILSSIELLHLQRDCQNGRLSRISKIILIYHSRTNIGSRGLHRHRKALCLVRFSDIALVCTSDPISQSSHLGTTLLSCLCKQQLALSLLGVQFASSLVNLPRISLEPYSGSYLSISTKMQSRLSVEVYQRLPRFLSSSGITVSLHSFDGYCITQRRQSTQFSTPEMDWSHA